MTRQLEQRYHVYQDLEQSFHSLYSRLDEMQASWVETTKAAPPEHSLMRVDNPELWDLEREYERRQAEQLSEISDKSRRVAELMGRIEALEPLAEQLAERDREFVALEESQLALEPLKDEVCDLRAQVEQADQDIRDWRDKHDRLLLESTEDQARLREEIEATQLQLEEQLATRAEAERESQELIESMRADVESKASQLFLRDELIGERDTQVAEVTEELNRTRAEHDQKVEELAARDARLTELEDSWSAASGQVAEQRSKLMSHESHFEAAQSMLSQLKPLLTALENNLTVEEQAAAENALDEVLPEIQPEIEEEPAAALPIKTEDPETAPDEEFDLSVFDGDEGDFKTLGDPE